MVVGCEQQTGNMRYRQSDKGHRSAEGGGDSRQDARNDEQPVAHPQDIHPEILGIAVAEHQGIQRFDEQQRPREARQRHCSEDGDIRHRHPAKASHAPDQIRLHPLVGSKEVE